MADDLIFYTNPMSRGRIIRWMLEELGASYRTEIIDYAVIKDAAYLAINPMGKVPAIRHHDTIVTECPAICAYLADAFPDAGLAPPPAERGAYYRWLFFAAGPVEAATTNQSMGFEPPVEKQGMVGYGNYNAVMDTLEKTLAGGGYIAGERFSAADVYLGSHLIWGLQFGTIEERPGFAKYRALVSDRDAYQRASKLDDAAMPEKSA